MFDSTLQIIIKARDDASQVVNGFNSKLKSMEPAFKKMATVGTVAFGAIAAVAVSSLKESAAAAADMAIANQTLENAMNNMTDAQFAAATGWTKGASALEDLKGQMDDASKAALNLGFDDEAAAKSFAKLFQVTKSAAEAHKELQIAMDLARDKGISLEDATQKLVMVHAGNTKALKQENLEINENATALENINNLATVYAGKAAAYANTSAGQFDIFREKINNVKQAIGDSLSPAFTKALGTIQPFIDKFMEWVEKNPEIVSKIVIIGGAIAGLTAVVGALGLAFTILTSPISLVILAIIALGALVAIIIKKWEPIKQFFSDLWKGIKDTFKSAIDGIVNFFEPLTNIIQKVENALARVGQGVANIAKSVGGKISNFFSGGKAQGGMVSSGSSYLVGEHGPEMFTPGTSGSITPNNQLSGNSGSFTVNINGGNYLSEDAALKMGDIIIKALQTQMRGA